jgi:hypothetical protein
LGTLALPYTGCGVHGKPIPDVLDISEAMVMYIKDNGISTAASVSSQQIVQGT